MGTDGGAPSRGDEQQATALEHLARRLRELRDHVPLSLRDLQRQTHVSDSSLSRYLAGQALPPWKTVEVLSRLGGGNTAELRGLWEQARVERRRARSAAPAAPPAPAARSQPPPPSPEQLAAWAAQPPPTQPPPTQPPPTPVPTLPPQLPHSRRQWWTAVLAAVATAATLVAVFLATRPPPAAAPDGDGTSIPRGLSGDVRATITNNGPRGFAPDNRSLTVADQAVSDGARVHLWRWDPDGASLAQIWVAEEHIVGDENDQRRWRFWNINSERCLDRGGTGAGAEVFQWSCNDSASQLWYFDDHGMLRNELDQRCVAVKDGEWRDGAALEMADCQRGWTQRWYLSFQTT